MKYRVHILGCAPRSGTTLLAELMVNGYETDDAWLRELPTPDTPRGDEAKTLPSTLPDQITFRQKYSGRWQRLWGIIRYAARFPRKREVILASPGSEPADSPG